MDLVIIVVLIIFSFIPHCIYSNVVSKNNKNFYATIKINGKVHTTIDLPVASEKDCQYQPIMEIIQLL